MAPSMWTVEIALSLGYGVLCDLFDVIFSCVGAKVEFLSFSDI